MLYYFLLLFFNSNAAVSTIYGCNKCTKGKIAATSSAVCLECATGKYQPLNIATTNACSDCGGGQFAANGSAVACSICAIGQFQDLTSAVEYTCKVCTPGSYQNSTKSVAINPNKIASSAQSAVSKAFATAAENITAKTSSTTTTEPLAVRNR